MSVESTIAFYGIQFEVPASEVEQLELRCHPLLLKAKTASLQHYWANFGGIDPKYEILIGKKLAVLGLENSFEFVITCSELQAMIEDVRQKLLTAGFEDEPKLLIQYLPPN